MHARSLAGLPDSCQAPDSRCFLFPTLPTPGGVPRPLASQQPGSIQPHPGALLHEKKGYNFKHILSMPEAGTAPSWQGVTSFCQGQGQNCFSIHSLAKATALLYVRGIQTFLFGGPSINFFRRSWLPEVSRKRSCQTDFSSRGWKAQVLTEASIPRGPRQGEQRETQGVRVKLGHLARLIASCPAGHGLGREISVHACGFSGSLK